MYSLKEGSQFEDLALMKALSEIIQTLQKSTGAFISCVQTSWSFLNVWLFWPYLCSILDDVGSLLKMMILFDNEEEARILQRNFEQLILMVEKSLSIIWPPEDTTGYQAHASQVWHNIYTVFKPGFHIVVSCLLYTSPSPRDA